MKETIYRKKTLDKMSSPEDLNRYMRVTNPPVWFALTAVILLLVGFIVWSIFGTLEGTETGVAVSADGMTICYISEEKGDALAVGKEVKINGKRYKITVIGKEPTEAASVMNDYAMHLGGFQDGQYVYSAIVDGKMEAGNYSCQFVTETVSAISFLWN